MTFYPKSFNFLTIQEEIRFSLRLQMKNAYSAPRVSFLKRENRVQTDRMLSGRNNNNNDEIYR